MHHGWRKVSNKRVLEKNLMDCRLIDDLIIEVFHNDLNIEYKRGTNET